MVSAGWYPDPLHDHEHRYWDGNEWTEHVADGGASAIAPLAPGAALPPPGVALGAAEPATTGDSQLSASRMPPEPIIENRSEALLCIVYWPLTVIAFLALTAGSVLASEVALVLLLLALGSHFALLKSQRGRGVSAARQMPALPGSRRWRRQAGWGWKVIGPRALSQAWHLLVDESPSPK
jgi:hypothetical protein